MQLRKPLTPEHERSLHQWLLAQGKPMRRQQGNLLLLSVALFISKLVLMWYLTIILHQLIIIGAKPAQGDFIAAVIAVLAQAALMAAKANYGAHFQTQLFGYLQQRLAAVLRHHNLALIRQQPIAHWQACALDRIGVISNFYADFLNQRKLASVAPIIVLAVAVAINPWVALILLISAPLIPLFMWLTGMGAASAHREHFQAIDRLSHQFLDRLRGRRLLQLFQVRSRAIDKAIDDLDEAGKELNERTFKVVRMAFLSGSVLDFFATVAMALVAVFVGFSLLGEIQLVGWSGPIDFQQGLFMLLITPLFYSELKLLGKFYHTKSEAIGAAAELKPVLALNDSNSNANDSSNKNAEQPAGQDKQSLPLAWSASQLVIGEQQLIRLPQLAIEAGAHINLTGPSGAGKSLLLEALLGQQQVRCDNGEPVPVLDSSGVSWLGQRAVISAASVRDNLTLHHRVDDGLIWQVLEQVGLRQRIGQLAQQLDTILGQNPPLSGGELHRLALARVLLLPSPVVLLDEPTAHLSDEQHQSISRLLFEQLKDKTIIWVSHKPLPDEWFEQRWHIEHGLLSVLPARQSAAPAKEEEGGHG